MNTESVQGRKVEYGQMEQPGDFCFSDNFGHINIWLPGQKGPDALRIQKGGVKSEARVWIWDGDEFNPTLTPSIHAPGEWHGYLTSGKLVSC